MRQLAQLQHENIARYIGFSSDEGSCQAFITERYRDSLSEKLFKQGSLSALQRFQIARGISMGLDYLHNFHNRSNFRNIGEDFPLFSLYRPRPLVHGNLASDSIQLSHSPAHNDQVQYIPKINHVSLMSIIRSYMEAHSIRFTLYTAGYAPPESRFGQHDQKSDVYSFGVILIELLTSRPAISIMEFIERGFSSPNTTGFMTRFKERYLDPVYEASDERMWRGLFDIAKLCLKNSKNERIDAIGVVEALNTLNNQLNTPAEAEPVKKTSRLGSNTNRKSASSSRSLTEMSPRSSILTSSSRDRTSRVAFSNSISSSRGTQPTNNTSRLRISPRHST